MQDEVTDDTGLTKDEFEVAFGAAAGLDDPVVTDPPVEAAADDVGEPGVPEPIVPDPVVVVAPEPVVPAPVVAAPPAPAPVVPEPLPLAALADENFTEEETALLASVKENFSEVANLLAATERVTVAKLENKFAAKIAELETKLSQSFAPAIDVAQTVAHDKFMSVVIGAHADAVELMPKVEEWVLTQPDFLQASYNAILDKGTAAQTVKLYDIFKKETGSAQVPPLPPPEDAEVKATKERKLRSQEGVRTRQVAQKGGIDENDFEGAFNAASTKH